MAAFSALICSADIVPMVETVDFGNIHETDGPKTVRLYLRNEGTTPNAIIKVRPTCGCTAADFQEEAIAPGDSAWIDLTYDPANRPGKFEKGVRVYPMEGEMIRIPIQGIVFSSPETVERMFPVDAGLLHITEQTLFTLSPLDSRERTLYIDTYNSGDSPVWLKLESDYEAIQTQPFPSPLPPGEKGTVGIYLNPNKEPRSGTIDYTLRLLTSTEAAGLDSATPFIITIHSEK